MARQASCPVERCRSKHSADQSSRWSTEVGIDAAQAQLGHDSADITRDFYVHKAALAPDLTRHLERFRPEQ